MTPKFTTPCIIYKNTPKLHEKLRELGYTIMCGYDTGFIMTWAECGIAFIPEGPKIEINRDSLSEYIDCGANEALFLAIVALREDSNCHHDYLQWFTTNDCSEWRQSKEDFCELRFLSNGRWHKATVEELIEHFKD